MKKILLANIGNRNLTFQGLYYDRKIHGDSFREWTSSLLDQYEKVSPELSETILSRIINPVEGQPGVVANEIEKLILFATNQVNETKQDQDTLHEAELIKRKFEQDYGFAVEIQQLQCRVTDNDALLHRYRNKLRGIIQRHPGAHFIICDAGGTAQLKFSLKIMAEYLLTPNQFEVLYVNINGSVETVPQTEYRRVIDDEQARSLVQTGQYRAALTLRGYVRPQDALGASNLADKLLLFAYARFNRLDELMGKLSESMKKRIVDYPNLLSTSQRQSILSNLSFANIVGTESLFMLGEWLAKVRTLHQTRRYNETVLAMAVFYEAYLAASIQHQFGYQLVDDGKRQDEVNRLLNDARRRFPTIASAYPDEKQRLSNDVPFQIIICRQIQYPDHQKFLALLDPWIARGKDKGAQLFQGRSVVGINTIRNKVAHNGRFILDEEWTSVLGYMDGFLLECYTLFGLPDSDPYAELNEAIVKQF